MTKKESYFANEWRRLWFGVGVLSIVSILLMAGCIEGINPRMSEVQVNATATAVEQHRDVVLQGKEMEKIENYQEVYQYERKVLGDKYLAAVGNIFYEGANIRQGGMGLMVGRRDLGNGKTLGIFLVGEHTFSTILENNETIHDLKTVKFTSLVPDPSVLSLSVEFVGEKEVPLYAQWKFDYHITEPLLGDDEELVGNLLLVSWDESALIGSEVFEHVGGPCSVGEDDMWAFMGQPSASTVTGLQLMREVYGPYTSEYVDFSDYPVERKVWWGNAIVNGGDSGAAVKEGDKVCGLVTVAHSDYYGDVGVQFLPSAEKMTERIENLLKRGAEIVGQ